MNPVAPRSIAHGAATFMGALWQAWLASLLPPSELFICAGLSDRPEVTLYDMGKAEVTCL